MTRSRLVVLALLWLPLCRFAGGNDGACAVDSAFQIAATGQDSRVDIQWAVPRPDMHVTYNILRSTDARGPFVQINKRPLETSIYSDFVGVNLWTGYYQVVQQIDGKGPAARRSNVVQAQTRAMSDDELLTSVQRAVFRYFWDNAHPVSGLAYERCRSGSRPRGACTIGGTGFGLMAIMVGAERGFITRRQAAARVLEILTFLQEKSTRYHGAWSHWLDGKTGQTIPFSKFDDGGDLVETSYLVQGMLTLRAYFREENSAEREIRARITRMWREVEWDWYLGPDKGRVLYWHWSPRYGWKMHLPIVGFNECMITYLLAIASPAHAIAPECYHDGWAGRPGYANGHAYYGEKQWVGRPMGGPLFFTNCSFLGFDPRGKHDRFCNYFENNQNISLIHHAYCCENPGNHVGYGPGLWGLTASDGPDGYRACSPTRDDGTVAPTAALSAMPYTPVQSLAALKHMYREHGKRLWGEYGFRDAMNLDKGWYADTYLAIDQGPIICMIENHRSALCWRMFMTNPEIRPMLQAIGWQVEEDTSHVKGAHVR